MRDIMLELPPDKAVAREQRNLAIDVAMDCCMDCDWGRLLAIGYINGHTR